MEADGGIIRKARQDDIEDVSAMIRNTLLISNSVDYDIQVIRNLSHQYSPKSVADMALRRDMYVYVDRGRINGTVSFKGDTIFAFFVAPDRQRTGVGSRLLEFIERKARSTGLRVIKVGASITAKAFYVAKGYKTIRKEGDGSYGDVFYMEKQL